MILIGSQAIKHRNRPDLIGNRDPKDLDIICTWEDFLAWKNQQNKDFKIDFDSTGSKAVVRMPALHSKPIEFEFAWPGSTAERLVHLVETDLNSTIRSFPDFGTVIIPSLDVLYTIKSTHRFVSGPHFKKTMDDWLRMDSAGLKVPIDYRTWYEYRSAETVKKKPPRLKGNNKETFFNPNEGVKYVYDHDSIHRIVAYSEVPAYTLFKKDGAEVECDEQKFNALSYGTKLRSVAEEAMVLAIERAHVPYGKLSAYDAFIVAMEKVCTVISSGWWRAFAYRNYNQIIAQYDITYLDRFKAAVAAGKVPLYSDKTY